MYLMTDRVNYVFIQSFASLECKIDIHHSEKGTDALGLAVVYSLPLVTVVILVGVVLHMASWSFCSCT